jgi:hypothetical protein
MKCTLHLQIKELSRELNSTTPRGQTADALGLTFQFLRTALTFVRQRRNSLCTAVYHGRTQEERTTVGTMLTITGQGNHIGPE